MQGYVEPEASYRSTALDIGEVAIPAGLSRSTIWGNAPLASPSPSTIFRWVARFAAGASAWWPLIVAAAQEQLAQPIFLADQPAYLARKARIPGKPEQLAMAWSLLYVLFLLTSLGGQPPRRWPYDLLRAAKCPSSLDYTRWFAKPARAPP